MRTSSKPTVNAINALQARYDQLHYFESIFDKAVAAGEIHFSAFIFMKSSPGFETMRQGISRELNEALLRVAHEFEELGIEPNPYVPNSN